MKGDLKGHLRGILIIMYFCFSDCKNTTYFHLSILLIYIYVYIQNLLTDNIQAFHISFFSKTIIISVTIIIFLIT